MHAAVRRYKFDPRFSSEINQKVQNGFVPILRNAPGFVAYYWVDTGAGEAVSLSIFQSAKGAEESVRIAADFAHKNLASMLGKPEILQGEVKAHA